MSTVSHPYTVDVLLYVKACFNYKCLIYLKYAVRACGDGAVEYNHVDLSSNLRTFCLIEWGVVHTCNLSASPRQGHSCETLLQKTKQE